MALIYVTGPPGVGKSTIEKELNSRGYQAYDIDDPSLGGAYNKATGQRVSIPPADQRETGWFDKHEWRTDTDALRALKDRSTNTDIFVCGVTPSDETILSLFDKIVYLQLDDDKLAQRIKQRAGNDYGKNENELADILKRKAILDFRYVNAAGVQIIDASENTQKIVDALIN